MSKFIFSSQLPAVPPREPVGHSVAADQTLEILLQKSLVLTLVPEAAAAPGNLHRVPILGLPRGFME